MFDTHLKPRLNNSLPFWRRLFIWCMCIPLAVQNLFVSPDPTCQFLCCFQSHCRCLQSRVEAPPAPTTLSFITFGSQMKVFALFAFFRVGDRTRPLLSHADVQFSSTPSCTAADLNACGSTLWGRTSDQMVSCTSDIYTVFHNSSTTAVTM